MTVEEFDNLSTVELRTRANTALEQYAQAGLDKPYYLLEAQLYMGEIDRREERRFSRRIARRDFWLELVVIFLIGWEIYEGSSEAKILQQVAENAATTATVLKSLQTTTETMSAAVQSQEKQATQLALDATRWGDAITQIMHAIDSVN